MFLIALVGKARTSSVGDETRHMGLLRATRVILMISRLETGLAETGYILKRSYEFYTKIIPVNLNSDGE